MITSNEPYNWTTHKQHMSEINNKHTNIMKERERERDVHIHPRIQCTPTQTHSITTTQVTVY